MDILVLGGTGFVGRHIAAEANGRGHTLTLFNRGSDRTFLSDVERLVGDRDGGTGVLGGRTWDAVVDVNGYLPRLVRDAVRAVRGRVAHYAFVSSVSVYRRGTSGPLAEDAEVGELEAAEVETIDRSTYGPLKVACERVVEEAFGAAALLIRPGVVVGPHDPTDRFTSWVRRVAVRREVLAPEGPDAPTQWIDARDLARWTVDALEGQLGGPFNLVAPPGTITIGSMLEELREATDSQAAVTYVDPGFLEDHDVRPGVDLPLWGPDAGGGLFRADPSRALATGLSVRRPRESARDTLAWDRGRGSPPLTAGLGREREDELLSRWHAHGKGTRA